MIREHISKPKVTAQRSGNLSTELDTTGREGESGALELKVSDVDLVTVDTDVEFELQRVKSCYLIVGVVHLHP